MLKDIFGSLGFVIVGSDILFWAYFFIMDNTCKMACRARLPRRKNKLEGSDLRSRSWSFRRCGCHNKKFDSRIPVFPIFPKKGIKKY